MRILGKCLFGSMFVLLGAQLTFEFGAFAGEIETSSRRDGSSICKTDLAQDLECRNEKTYGDCSLKSNCVWNNNKCRAAKTKQNPT